MPGDRSDLHRPGAAAPYRCGPCRKGKCDRCILIRCTCDHEGGISAEAVHAETERRLATATAQRGDRTQRVLRELAEAPAADPKGRAMARLAERCGERNLGSFGVALGKLDRQGLIRREIVGKRTQRIEITDAGRAATAAETPPMAAVTSLHAPRREDLHDVLHQLFRQAVAPFVPPDADGRWWAHLLDHFRLP